MGFSKRADKSMNIDLNLMEEDRLRLGLTLKEIAAKCDPPAVQGSISRLFNGDVKSLKLLVRVAKAMGYDHTRYLIFGQREQPRVRR